MPASDEKSSGVAEAGAVGDSRGAEQRASGLRTPQPMEEMVAKSVTVDIVSQPLSREENGVNFDVKEDTGFFGQLIVSKGGIRWRPKNKQDHHFISWSDLDKAARDYPRR
jgi:hypothetical protein